MFRRSAANAAEAVSASQSQLKSPTQDESSTSSPANSQDSTAGSVTVAPPEFRFIYPEFLPDPNMQRRNKLREKLERMDMLQRRSALDIPEFYTGIESYY